MVKALADQLDSDEGNAFIELANSKIKDGSLQPLFESTQDNGSNSRLLSGGRSNKSSAETKLKEFERKLKELEGVRNALEQNIHRVALPSFDGSSDVKILKVCMETYMKESKEGIPDPYLVVLRAGIKALYKLPPNMVVTSSMLAGSR
jgi:hypothetical protein